MVHAGPDAREHGGVVGGEVCKFELHQLRIVAEAAAGVAPEGMGERRFGCEERVC